MDEVRAEACEMLSLCACNNLSLMSRELEGYSESAYQLALAAVMIVPRLAADGENNSSIIQHADAASLLALTGLPLGVTKRPPYESQIETIERYLATCLQRRDWHGVSDAANDIRVMEAERETFDEAGSA